MEIFSSYYRNIAFHLSSLFPKEICVFIIQRLKQIEFYESRQSYSNDMVVRIFERHSWSHNLSWEKIHISKIINKHTCSHTVANIEYLKQLFTKIQFNPINPINDEVTKLTVSKRIITELNYRRSVLKVIGRC